MFLPTVPENLTINPDPLRSFVQSDYAWLPWVARPDPRQLPYFGAERGDLMAESIFSKIIAGQIPCHKVYEDEHVFAFLDINPLSRGHTLVIPKEPAATLDKLSDESAAALGRVLPRICRAVIAATGVTQYNVLENNGAAAHQAVFHVHFHIIPKPSSAQGLGISWPAQSLDKQDALALVQAMTQALKKAP
jgi:histidine triad (HIT) family protein